MDLHVTDHHREAVLLVGHGSRDGEGADEFRAFARELEARLPDGRPVVPCFLELAPPSVLEAIDDCAARGFHRLVAAPYFLFAAGHVKNDVPTGVQVGRLRHPGLVIDYGAPLGLQPEILTALDSRVRELEAMLTLMERDHVAVLLVERGSSDPDANANVFHTARMFWEGRGFHWVESSFIGITYPRVEEGIERCVRLGAKRVLVMPLFLFTGILVKRISEIVERERPRYPGVELHVGGHLADHPALFELALRRIDEAGKLHVHMPCDRCKYRVPLVGFEEQVGQAQASDHAHGLREHDHGHHYH
jgi:sirohydrochlorin cobaltochelatase